MANTGKNLTFVGSKSMNDIETVITNSTQDTATHTAGTPDNSSLCFVQGTSADDSSAVVFQGKVVKGLSKSMEDYLINQLFEEEDAKYSVTFAVKPSSNVYGGESGDKTLLFTISHSYKGGGTPSAPKTITVSGWPTQWGDEPSQTELKDGSFERTLSKADANNASSYSATVSATYSIGSKTSTPKTSKASYTKSFKSYIFAAADGQTSVPASASVCDSAKPSYISSNGASGGNVISLTSGQCYYIATYNQSAPKIAADSSSPTTDMTYVGTATIDTLDGKPTYYLYKTAPQSEGKKWVVK